MPFDIEAAVKHLEANAKPGPTGKCATYVRQALEAGGLNMASNPVSAKDYGPYLKLKGFTSISITDYEPAKGDVVVIQSYKGGNVNGHIAMFSGKQWISDFKQKDMWGGPNYRTNTPSYEVFRP